MNITLVENKELLKNLIHNKKKEWYRSKLFFLGDANAGKTTLIKCLKGSCFNKTSLIYQ